MDIPITETLRLAAHGDRAAFDEVFGSLYPELRRIARARLYEMGRQAGLGTTSLLHESFLRLVHSLHIPLDSRRHFFALASRCMRHTLIDELRRMNAERHGGGAEHLALSGDDALQLAAAEPDESAMELQQALQQLEKLDPELAEVVDMHWFGGFTEIEIAQTLGVSERTVRRRLDKGRDFLRLMLGAGADAATPRSDADGPDPARPPQG